MEKINSFEKKKPDEQIRLYIEKRGLRLCQNKPKYQIEKWLNHEQRISIDTIESFFENKNFLISEPIPLRLENATTLFVCSGIQKLENTIHKEEAFPEMPIFINQPVLRSQFMENNAVESHSSFFNITTLDIHCDIEKHIEYLDMWINLLITAGFEKEEFVLEIEECASRNHNLLRRDRGRGCRFYTVTTSKNQRKFFN